MKTNPPRPTRLECYTRLYQQACPELTLQQARARARALLRLRKRLLGRYRRSRTRLEKSS